MKTPFYTLTIALLLSAFLDCTTAEKNTESDGQNKSATEVRMYEQGDVKSLTADVGSLAIQQKLSDQVPVRVLWSVPFPSIKVSKVWLPPLESKSDLILVVSEKGDLISLNRKTGIPQWWTRLGGIPLGEPAYSRYGIYIIVNGFLLNIEPYSGEVIWRVRMGFPATPYMHVYEAEQGNPSFTIAALNRVVRGLALETSIWPPKKGIGAINREEIAIKRYNLHTRWQLLTDGLIEGPIAIHEGHLYVADSERRVYGANARNISNGRPKVTWRAVTRGPNASGLINEGPYIYLASRDRNIYCYARDSGSEIWRYETGFLLEETPIHVKNPVADEVAIVEPSRDGPLHVIEARRGKLLWTLDDGARLAGIDVDNDKQTKDQTALVIQNRDGSYGAYDFHTGEVIWKIEAGIFAACAQNGQEAFTYVLTPDMKMLLCLGRTR